MNIPLKQCPFCGDEAEMVNIENRSYYVRCKRYWCGAEQTCSDSLSEAKSIWNHRSTK